MMIQCAAASLALTSACAVCLGDIVYISDHRGANIQTSIHSDALPPQETINTVSPDAAFGLFSNAMGVINTAPDLGTATAEIEFSSSIDPLGFSSSATTSSSVQRDNASIVWTNAAYNFNIDFSVTTQTAFQIDASMYAFGESLSLLQIRDTATNDFVYSRDANDAAIHIQETIELDPGAYSFNFLSYSGALGWIDTYNDSATAGHDITVTVLPSPPTASCLLLLGFLTSRRRR